MKVKSMLQDVISFFVALLIGVWLTFELDRKISKTVPYKDDDGSIAWVFGVLLLLGLAWRWG